MPLSPEQRARIEAERRLERGIVNRQMGALERKVGIPSPSVRQLAAGSQPARTLRGPDEVVTLQRQHWHRVPADGMDHKLGGGSCWCSPKAEPESPTVTWWQHYPTAPNETDSGATPGWLEAIQHRDHD